MKQFYFGKKIFFTLLLSCIGLASFGQNSFNSGDGWGAGWGVGSAFSTSAGSSLIYTTSNTIAGNVNRYFRFFGNGTPCGEYGPSGGVDVQLTPGTAYTSSTITCGSAKAFYLVVPNTTDKYIFKSAGISSAKVIIFRVQGVVQTISNVTSSLANVYTNQSPTITATMSGALATGQGVYLRYTTDNFTTSTVVPMTSATSTTYTAAIPVQATGLTVKYYLFTSGTTTPSGADADWYTINLNNNGGSNFSYAVQTPPVPTISLGANPTICRGITSANLPYTATSNSPNQYSLTFDTTALGQGFSNVSNAVLPASPIVITVPATATAGTYNATLSVKNTSTGGVSTNSNVTVTIASLPTAGITNNTGVTKVTCSVPSISVTATGGTSYSWSNGTAVVGTNANLNITAAGTYTVTVTNASGCSATANIVITQDTATTSSSQSATACDSYAWSVNGQTYTTSGTYTFIGTNAAGCTDTKTLNLTINNSTSSTQTVSACDSYTWSVNGQTYTTSGTYTSTGTNAAGCSDTKTLVLTIFVSTPSSQTVTACDSYFWSINGQTYTSSGTYVFAGTNAAGCPQNITLNLTITPSTSNTTKATACDAYTWSVNGQTYTTSGVRSVVSGCHTEVLDLTINNATSSSQSIAACDSYTWSANGQTYSTSGVYTFVGTNAAGCPDTKTLNLTITPSTVATTTISACDSYTWTAGTGLTYTESGNYTFTNGCHTQTLALTITPSSSTTTTANSCDSYTWSVNGQTYTASGIRTLVTGCHTEVLNLTINNSSSSTQTVSACDTYTWSVNGQTYTTSGTYSYIGTTAAGCPDTKNLVLTINNSTSSSQTVAACESYTWAANGQTYTTSGTYTSVSTNASGCPDTKTLLLTITPYNLSNAGSTWVNGQNDNIVGFGAWNFTTVGTTAGFFSGSSDVNNGGSRSWGMFASGGSNVASATRPVSMNIGNTLRFSMDNGFIDTGKTVGFGIQNATGQNLMEVYFVGGQAFYTLNDSAGANPTTIGYTSGGLDFTINYTSSNTYSITLRTKAGATATYTGRTFAIQSGGQLPAQIRFFNAGAGTGSNFDLFFNSLAINNPVITVQPSTTTQGICVGATASNLSVSASGTDLTYQWYRNTIASYLGSQLISGANASTITPQSATAGTTYYYCIVTGACGSTTSLISAAITVTSPPNAGSISGGQEVCVNGLTTFSTNGSIGGSWTSSATSIATVNNLGIVTGINAGLATISYTLNGSGGCSSATATKDIIVNALPTAAITNNTGSSIITCATVAINVTATGGSSYSWSNGLGIVGTSADLAITTGGTYTVTVTNAAGCSSSAIITITENKTTTSSESLVACDTFTWGLNGQTYTTSGDYTFVSTNEAGCTNTATLHLIINNSSISNETISACDSYTWSVNEQTYTESGVYTFVGTNGAGCTDTKTLNLTITPSTSNTTTASACDTYTWSVNNQAYTTSGTYSVVNGCHTEVLNLTITPSTSNTTTASACDTYTWSVNNQAYTTSGTYSVVNGCHTEVLNLTITPSTSNTTTASACDSYTWSVNNQAYTTSGTYSVVNGCHTEVLNLTITPSTSNTTTASACDTYTWSVNNQAYTTSGTYSVVSGCHTEVLELTITPSTSNTTTASACDTYTWSVNNQAYTTSGTYSVVNGCHTEVLELTITPSTSNTTTASACDTYTWSVNNQAYTTSGTYSVASGCHTEVLELTITPSTSNTTTASACDTYTWSVNNQAYTGSGVYSVVSGCHTEVLELTITPSTSNTTTASACDTYTWSVNNQAYTASGTYSVVSGCHTEVLELTITPSTSNTTTASACDTYTWSVNNQEYTASGTYSVVNGCHTEVLNLTITPSTSNTTTASACDTYTWSVNNQAYTTSGTYSVVSGCHTEVLNLTITPSTSNTTTASACDTYTWSVNNQAYTTSGTYSVVSGCHTELLNLTITPSTSTTTTTSSCGDYLWSVNGQTYTTSGTYTYVSGCHTEILNLTVATCSSTLNLKVAIQGYYDTDAHAMRAVKANQGVGTSTTAVDDITVELRDVTDYHVVASVTASLQTDGTAVCTYATAPTGSFYVSVAHRNSIQVMSATPVTVGATPASYDFTTAASKAFGDNQVLVDGVYTMYSGDFNQDGFVDIFDYPAYDAANQSGGAFDGTYVATDLNGDGFVGIFDYPIYDVNNQGNVQAVLPYSLP